MFVRLEDGFISTSKRSDDSTTMYRLNLADCVVAYDTRSGRIDVATPVLDLRHPPIPRQVLFRVT